MDMNNAFIFNVLIERNFGKDYFNERDEATDCEEPRSKTVNLFRFSRSSFSSVELPSPPSSILINTNTMFITSLSQIITIIVVVIVAIRDPVAREGHVRPVASIAWNPEGEQ